MADEQSPYGPPTEPNPPAGNVVYAQPPEPQRQKQSRLSIASIIMAGIAIVLGLSGLLLIDETTQEMNPRDIVGSIGFGGSILIAIVGTALGLGGCFHSGHARPLGVVGAVINGMVLLATFFLVIIGILAEAAGLN